MQCVLDERGIAPGAFPYNSTHKQPQTPSNIQQHFQFLFGVNKALKLLGQK